AARAGDRTLRAPGLQPRTAGHGARGQRDQRRPCGDDPRWQLPRRSVLPPQYRGAGAAGAGRTSGRHRAAGRAFPVRRQATVLGGHRRTAAAHLAGQRPRTAQRHPARGTAGHRQPHRSGRPQSPACSARAARHRRRRSRSPAHRERAGQQPRHHRPGRRRTRPEPAGAVPPHGSPRHSARMKPRSYTFRLFLRLLPVLALAAALPWMLAYWMDRGWLVALVSGLVLLTLMWWSLVRATAPVRSLMRALSGVVSSYRDGEFNFSVHWDGHDELGRLVQAHRELGDVLRAQRQGLVQRELLLDTMVQNTPVAMLLLADGGDGIARVVFSHVAARKLLHGGWTLEGQRLGELLEQMPAVLADAIARGGDSLFAVQGEESDDEDDEQIYHLSRRAFQLNGRPHDLLLIRLLTAELRRQEVQTWKKVIRVISHELNNSLAPIASLAHSGAELVRRGRTDRLEDILGTVEERARHLEGFIRGYARFAKLPQPQLQTIVWAPFLGGLQQQIPFRMVPPPD